ncbi:MAG TPA: MBL fold metallo-hydrolase [Thermoanaerobaculia bacterium]|nr:MBL fold metallo-hydrolase [Thermoanaerobaculia bacterium]
MANPSSRRRRNSESAGLQSVFDFFLPPEPGLPEPEPSRPAGPPLRVGILGSGSGGNAVIVESGPHRLLIDAGFSCREIVKRMKRLEFDPSSLGALVLTHEHNDHCRGAERLAKKFKLPVYATAGTLDGAGLRQESRSAAVEIRSGEAREVAGFVVEPFLIPHDAAEPIGLLVEDPHGRRLGLVADLGCRTSLAWGRLRDVDVLILETNHDLDMLRNGPYPWSLKQRVAGRHGHLSNREAAEGLPELIGDRLRWVVLYHLSRTNNLPALAAAAVGETLDRECCPAHVAITEQDHPTPWLEVT